jgi:hypothetical protein
MSEAGEKRSSRRRIITWSVVGIALLVVLGGIWLLVTGLLVRSQLQDVRAEVHQLRDEVAQGQLAQARVTLASLQTHASRAHSLSTGPAWAVASVLPFGGDPVDTVRGIADNVNELAKKTLPALLEARQNLDPATLRRADGSIDLAPIVKVAPTLASADSAVSHATKDVHALPGDTWLSPVDSARRDILDQLEHLSATVRSADLGAHIVPPMLGNDGVRRYFVGFQNEAEARGTGGLPGAFGIMQVTHGKAKFLRFEKDSYLSYLPTGLRFGRDYERLYGGYQPQNVYVNSDASPHFPYAAQIWTAMWQKKTGQHLDGALSIDPTALSYLLGPTGGVTLKDGTVIDASNVVSTTENTIYTRFPNSEQRKAYLVKIARAVSTHVIDSHAATSSLVDAVGRAIGERRVMVWSADPSVEKLLTGTAASGSVPKTTSPYASTWLVNAAGNKLDYYVSASLAWARTGCGSTRTVTATITLRNDAPAAGLPPYVTNRSDVHTYRVQPGDARDYLSYAATNGALLDSATLDGRPTTVAAGNERGHPVYSIDLEIPRGTSRTLVLHLTEPSGSGPLLVLPTPMVHPMTVATSDAKC